MNKKNIILDVDTGSDDAIAIVLAAYSKQLNLMGICSVNGNKPIEMTTENTLRVATLVGGNIPVYEGARLPMVSTLLQGRRDEIPFYGEKNVTVSVHQDYLDLPKATKKVESMPAVMFYVNALREAKEKVTIVAVGPLTNLGLALRIDPTIVKQVEEIVIMGGGYQVSNRTSAAEFNFWVDPEAAKIVLDSGAKITLITLDATHSAAISSKDADELYQIGTPASVFVSNIIEERRIGYNAWQPMKDTNTVPIHDALAIAYLIDSSVIVRSEYCYVDVDVSYGICDGRAVCDVEHKFPQAKKNAVVAYQADPIQFANVIKTVLKERE